MQHDAFIGQVQDRARLDSRGTAEAVTRATLETVTGDQLDRIRDPLTPDWEQLFDFSSS